VLMAADAACTRTAVGCGDLAPGGGCEERSDYQDPPWSLRAGSLAAAAVSFSPERPGNPQNQSRFCVAKEVNRCSSPGAF
jgi:hypothetical protein